MRYTDEIDFYKATRPEIARERIVQIVERIERLESEKSDIAQDIKEVYAEAKSAGYQVKALRKVIRERKIAEQERREQEALVEMYKNALGME